MQTAFSKWCGLFSARSVSMSCRYEIEGTVIKTNKILKWSGNSPDLKSHRKFVGL